jgi:hypothetical protein
MTTDPANGKGFPTEDPWAEAQAGGGMRRGPSAVLDALPSELDVAAATMADAMRAVNSRVSRAPDDTLLLGASIASGLAIGLLVGSAPRILALGAVLAAVSLGVTLVQRHPGHRRAFGRPVMA